MKNQPPAPRKLITAPRACALGLASLLVSAGPAMVSAETLKGERAV